MLEVGIGTGIALPLYRASARVVGIDPCEAMLARAAARVRRLGLGHVTLAAMDGERMDFADGSFDAVVAMYIVSVAADPARLLAEMRRVCAPGGEIVVLNRLSEHRPPAWIEAAAAHFGFRLAVPPAVLAPLNGLAVVERRRLTRLTDVHLLRFRKAP